ncbi:MAG: glycosyltransferase family 2 protein [Thalassotalea sp.]|nr:glycosyltransferase family 2 protein [Thalassotalea sp.]
MYQGSISVIFTTYNSVAWLEKVLWGFHYQTDNNFEVIVADDGSREETKEAIERFKKNTHLEVQHVWQPDDGFQKCRIMNKALKAAKGDYVLFTDGDCIPRNDFVAVHRKHAEEGFYLSGGYFKLPMDISKRINRADIETGRAFDSQWLLDNGLKKTHKISKLTARGWWAKFMNSVTPTNRTWNGHNASGWKKDLFDVNGFDESMQYGGQDCELGYRLRHNGIKAKQIRYSAICVHLDHARSYVNPEMLANSRLIKKNTLSNKLTFTENGLVKKQSS